MRALWVDGPGAFSLRQTRVAAPAAGQVLVRTRYSGISRGVETRVATGTLAASEHTLARAPFQEGELPFPVKYGQACVGTVEVGPDALLGRSVFCPHPHQEAFVVDARWLNPLPARVPPERAVLAASADTALNVLRGTGIAAGHRVAVVGASVVGALVARLAARRSAHEVVLVDIDTSRQPLADALGVGFAIPDQAPTGCDVVVHASASEAGLATAMGCAAAGVRVVGTGCHGLAPAARMERAPLSGPGAQHAADQDGLPSPLRMQAALESLDDACLDALISGESAFATAATDYAGVLAHAGMLCHRLRY